MSTKRSHTASTTTTTCRTPPPIHSVPRAAASLEFVHCRTIVPGEPPGYEVPWKRPLLRIEPLHLPPYPVIASSSIHSHARTHIGHIVFPGSSNSRARSVRRELDSNKVLEVLGDSFLKSFVLKMLITRYPNLTAASLPRLVAPLVSNATISWFAWHYAAFDPTCDGDITDCARSPFFNQNPCADLFEAYVGGLVQDGSTDRLEAWLNELYTSEVFPELEEVVQREMDEEHRKITEPPRKRQKQG